MRNMIRHFLKDERANTAVMVGLLMVPILLFAGLAIDVGMMMETRRYAQNTADAACLAGAWGLFDSQVEATANAQTAATNNGLTLPTDTLSVTFPASDLITVTTSRWAFFSFVRVIGIPGQQIQADATCQIGSAISGFGPVPLGLAIQSPETDCTTDPPTIPDPTFGYALGRQYDLKLDNPGSPGNFQPLDLDGNRGGGASEFEEQLVNGGPTISLCQDIYPETGNMVGATIAGLTARIQYDNHTFADLARCSGGGVNCTSADWARFDGSYVEDGVDPPDWTWGTYPTAVGMWGPGAGGPKTDLFCDPECKRNVVIPFIDDFPQGQSDPVRIMGFGYFHIENVIEGGKGKKAGENTIRGRFFKSTASPLAPGDLGAVGAGAPAVKLIE